MKLFTLLSMGPCSIYESYNQGYFFMDHRTYMLSVNTGLILLRNMQSTNSVKGDIETGF